MKRAALIVAILLYGCGVASDPTMTKNIKDERDASNATLVFREFKSSLYLVEINGRKFLHNSDGGILEVK